MVIRIGGDFVSGSKLISRRSALARIGLGAAAAYVSPTVTGLSQARASSSPTAPSNPTPASEPTPPSTVTAPSNPTAPSNAQSDSTTTSQSNSGNSVNSTNGTSGPSGPGACRVPGNNGAAQISEQEYQRAQRAISRGEVRPLREVLRNVLGEHPGHLVQVGYSESGANPTYRVQIVEVGGAVLTVSVNAASGRITQVRKC